MPGSPQPSAPPDPDDLGQPWFSGHLSEAVMYDLLEVERKNKASI